jgi:hypothetical protein
VHTKLRKDCTIGVPAIFIPKIMPQFSKGLVAEGFRGLTLMVSLYSQWLVRRMRENPLSFFCLLLALIVEGIALWLLYICGGDLSDIGRHRAEIASAVSQLGLTFLIPTFFSLRGRFSSIGAEDTAASLDWSRLRRSFVMAERIAFSIWVATLALALALVIAALSGKHGLALRLEFIVAALNLIACAVALMMALVIPLEPSISIPGCDSTSQDAPVGE